MAGFMSVLRTKVYNGTYRNGTGNGVANGILLALEAVDVDGEKVLKLVKPTAGTGKFLVKEPREVAEFAPYDTERTHGYAIEVQDPGDLYFIENLVFVNESNEEWDTLTYEAPDGALLRAHKLESGEEFVTDEVEGEDLKTGAALKATADGKLAV